MIRVPTSSLLCPYTTLFRSEIAGLRRRAIESASAIAHAHRANRRRAVQFHANNDPRLPTDLRDAHVRLQTLIQLRSEEHTSELQSQSNLVCRLLLEKKNKHI